MVLKLHLELEDIGSSKDTKEALKRALIEA